MSARRARIRPSYEEWYPRIKPGVWHNAAWLTEIVLQQQRSGSPTWALEGRALDEAHFEFEGYGAPRGSSRSIERRRK